MAENHLGRYEAMFKRTNEINVQQEKNQTALRNLPPVPRGGSTVIGELYKREAAQSSIRNQDHAFLSEMERNMNSFENAANQPGRHSQPSTPTTSHFSYPGMREHKSPVRQPAPTHHHSPAAKHPQHPHRHQSPHDMLASYTEEPSSEHP